MPGNVYALVVVNKGNVLTNDGEWKLKGESLTGKTFDYFRTTAQTLTASELASVTSDAEGSFFMTNAPLYTNPGGVTDPNGGNAVTLTKLIQRTFILHRLRQRTILQQVYM